MKNEKDGTLEVEGSKKMTGLSRRGFIQGIGGAGALLGLAGKSMGAEAPRDADGNIIPGFEKIKEDPNSLQGMATGIGPEGKGGHCRVWALPVRWCILLSESSQCGSGGCDRS